MLFCQSRSGLFLLIVLLSLYFVPTAGAQSQSVPPGAKAKKDQGSTYYRNEGGDLDKLIERQPTVDGVAEFVLIVDGNLPVNNARISLYAFDVDEERGETDKVYFNGHYLGNLSGTNDTWNTTVFNLELSWIKKGENQVRVVFTDSSDSGTIKWSGKIDWVQMLVDGGAAAEGRIEEQQYEWATKGGKVAILSGFNILPVQSGKFRLETTMLDKKGNALVATTKDFSGEKGQQQTIKPNLEYQIDAPTDSYKVVTSLFYLKDGMWLQQTVNTIDFEHSKGIGYKAPALLIKNPLPDLQVKVNAPPSIIDLSAVFGSKTADHSYIDSQITKTVLKSTNPALIETDLVGNSLTIRYLPNRVGRSDITLRGSFGDQSIIETFSVTVSPEDNILKVFKPIGDIRVNEDAPPTIVSLDSLFVDRRQPVSRGDEATAIIKSIIGNNNPQLLTASISENRLTINYRPNQWGNAELVIRGSYEEHQLDHAIKVSVLPIDDAPVVENPIADLQIKAGTPSGTIDLKPVFSDIDVTQYLNAQKEGIESADIKSLTYIVSENSNPELVTAQLDGTRLNLSFKEGGWGKAELTIEAGSDGKKVSDTFNIFVEETATLGVFQPIADVEVPEDGPIFTIDLSGVFGIHDKKKTASGDELKDIDPDAIQVSLSSNSAPSLVKTEIRGENLVCQPLPDMSGEATITITGSRYNRSIKESFKIVVLPIDDPPVINQPIEKIEFDEDAGDQIIDLSQLFTDIDNDDRLILIKVLSDNSQKLARVKIEGHQLTLTPKKDKNGLTTLMLEGNSNRQTIKSTIPVYITPVDDPPIVTRNLDDIKTYVGADSIEISIATLFSDVDNHPDEITLSAESFDPAVVQTDIKDGTLTLFISETNDGSGPIKITAESNARFADTEFHLIVEPRSNVLFGYFALGTQQIKEFSSAPMLTVGLGFNLDGLLEGFSTELEVAGNITEQTQTLEYYDSSSDQTVPAEREVNTSTLGLYLTYKVWSIKELFGSHSLDFRIRLGYLLRDDHFVTKPESATISSSEETESTTGSSFAVNMLIPFEGASGFFLEAIAVGDDLTRVGLGYRSTGRDLD